MIIMEAVVEVVDTAEASLILKTFIESSSSEFLNIHLNCYSFWCLKMLKFLGGGFGGGGDHHGGGGGGYGGGGGFGGQYLQLKSVTTAVLVCLL